MSITDKLFDQCVNLIGNDKNQEKLKSHIIDPLVSYFKHKLRFFFIVIIVLLCMILLANLVLVGYFVSLRVSGPVGSVGLGGVRVPLPI